MKSTFLGRAYLDGEVICRQGDLGDCMYVIQEGCVELLYRKGEKEYCLGTLKTDDSFGESSMLTQEVRPMTARAVGVAIVLTIEKRTFFQRIHEDPSFSMKIIRRMSERIHELEKALISTVETQPIDVAALIAAAAAAPKPNS